ncbi:uncharacterized protein LOC133206212 [Saccostrea echinata]|uniref:uncharacterized protein LOC133206212 n=1 Tax=Saccostrea echinata TaxID=191078 RepID=UPI002A82FB89|nr:uncharacterized protein LOC133206212 [Saccostrea echinata]
MASTSMRRIFLLVSFLDLFVVGFCDDFSLKPIIRKVRAEETLSDDERTVLARADERDLPPSLQRLVRDTLTGEHLCCRNTPLPLVTKSRSVARHHLVHDKPVTTYVTEYYKEVVERSCPQEHIVCCNMYIMVAYKCVYLRDLHEVAVSLLG